MDGVDPIEGGLQPMQIIGRKIAANVNVLCGHGTAVRYSSQTANEHKVDLCYEETLNDARQVSHVSYPLPCRAI